MNYLKPCPFCGMKRFLRHSNFHGCDVWEHPKNDDCYFSEMYFRDRPDLVEKWNTRKEPKRCCGNCKHYLDLSRDYEESVCQHPNRIKYNVTGYDNCDNWKGVCE